MIRRIKSLVIFFLFLLLLFLLYTIDYSEKHGSTTHKVNRLNASSLQRLQSYRQVLMTNKTLFSLKEGICSNFDTNPRYEKLIANYMKAWQGFVPDPYLLDLANCWCTESILPSLPKHLYLRMRLLHHFRDVQNDFKESEIKMVLQMMKNRTLPATDSITDTRFCLPTVYLIGMPKCGTTLLHSYLKSHPQVVLPYNKEGHFWRDLVSTLEPQLMEFQVLLYLYHFYSASAKIKEDSETIAIDASASTIFATPNPLREAEMDVCTVPVLMFSTIPNARFLVIMRNPVDRLWSDFWYFCSREHWKYKNVYKVPDSVLSVASEMFHNFTVTAIQEFTQCLYSGHTHFHCTTLAGSYPGKEGSCERVRLGLSIYYIHLVKWFNVFPPKLIMPIKFENLIADPMETLDEVWYFLEVSPIDVQPINKRMNDEWIVSSEYSEHFKMWPETRALLKKFFEPYNLALAELLENKDYLWD